MYAIKSSLTVFAALLLMIPASLVQARATDPPPELLRARAAFEAARTEGAAHLVPIRHAHALGALEDAERSQRLEGDTARTRARARVAAAMARSSAEAARQARAEAEVARVMERYRTQARSRHGSEARTRQDRTDALIRRGMARPMRAATPPVARHRRVQAEMAPSTPIPVGAQRPWPTDALLRVAEVDLDDQGRVARLTIPGAFARGAFEPFAAARYRLSVVADFLARRAAGAVVVEGHTDGGGGVEDDLGLSIARAERVRELLLLRGADPTSVETIGFGDSQPSASTRTAAGRAYNRRVEILLPAPALLVPGRSWTH